MHNTDVKSIARTIAESMPEFLALQQALLNESSQVRRVVATCLHDWAFDVTTGMSSEEQAAFLTSVRAELALRGKSEGQST